MNTISPIPLDVLERIDGLEAVRTCLKEHPGFSVPATVKQLHAEILSGIVVDAVRAHKLAKLSRWFAEVSQDEYALGLADRCEGHVQYASSDYTGAVRCYESAAQRFERLGRNVDVARTLTGAMQSLIYLGLDDKALQFSERARRIFVEEGDALRIARLDSNVGNIFYRQDRYAEARGFYQRAFERLVSLNRHQDAAAVLSNMACSSTGIGEFEQAAAEYSQAREIAQRDGLNLLAAELDYNIAYLHFLRGNHTRALVLYRNARRHSETAGDEYHAALCDLDEAEVYFDLNLLDESLHLSRRAASRFEHLGMNYERAKALTFLGIGEHHRQNTQRALMLFSIARRLFVAGDNPVWPAIVNYYRSILLRDLGQTRPALKLALQAERAFEAERLPHRRALARLLMASIFLRRNRVRRALNCCAAATASLSPADHPMLFFHAEYLRGRILQALGDKRQALTAFAKAAGLFEGLRSRLAGDDLKVAFVRNKLDVYSQLMILTYELEPPERREAAAFDFVERSKSRSLADRIAFLETDPSETAHASSKYLRVREKLNALYREIDLRESGRRNVRTLRDRAEILERQLVGMLRQQSLEDISPGTVDWMPVSLEAVATSLPSGARMVEFFITDHQLWVCIVGKAGATFKRLGIVDPIYSALKLLTFQLSRVQGQSYAVAGNLGKAATLSHLQSLYRLLIQPVESMIDASDLIILPHGLLHQIPFHALHDGSSYLIERSTVSYAPSATVLCHCERNKSTSPNRSLLVGVPDEKSPAIADEIQSIVPLLPAPRVFSGEKATVRSVFEYAASCRYIHIAAHGEFRSDNPMFSSIRLADGQINVLDLHRLRLSAELVTLSGCSTGAAMIAAGDELVGLARGLLGAGTRAVLLALWKVHDPSTAAFMRCFYENLGAGKKCAAALRAAMLQLKRDWPEPYYWAPFTVSGWAL
jgi:tetratricopeptide (TPR) repeat protein